MYLKSIDIKGFKSFADKTEIILKKGITAIVGPNGSGKSNVSDAVRWVLGEQSIKSLRGSKMEDVIFAGTQYRKALGLAQVAITLDNETGWLPVAYNDVTISRRLYRSGESEYYINSVLCRLKDVQELFMDTGIGKEGYSIIGQGKIEAILSGKPEDRRNLLEEAAGIVKFRSRKDEAERRLVHTEENVIRLADILGTYEERLEPLKEEREKASTFITLSENLKGKEVNLIIQNIEKINKKCETLHLDLTTLTEDLVSLSSVKGESKLLLDSENNHLEELQCSIEATRQNNYNDKTLHQNMMNEINLLKEKGINTDNLLALYKDNIEKDTNKINMISKHLEDCTNLYNEKKLSLKNLLISTQELLDVIDKNKGIFDETQRLLTNLKEDKSEITNEIIDNKNTSIIIENDSLSINNRIDQLKFSCENFQKSLALNDKSSKDILSSIEKVKENILLIQNKIDLIEVEIISIKKNLGIKEEELKVTSSTLNKLEATSNLLINLEKQHEGYNKTVRNLMMDLESSRIVGFKDKCFVVGQIITIEKELETAIEIALGGAISDLITTDDTTAKDLIEYLKKNNLGRATFLPLNIIKGKKLHDIESLMHLDGYIGIASELISYDIKFSKAIDFLLGKTIIAKDMNSALNIAKRSEYKFKIVTLTGEMINPGGSLTGGSINSKSSGIFTRKREILEHRDKIILIKKDIEKIENGINTLKSKIIELEKQRIEFKDKQYRENIEITKLNGRISAIENDSLKLKQNLALSTEELNVFQDNLNKKSQELSNNSNNIIELENHLTLVESKINEIIESNSFKEKEVVTLKDDLLKLQLEKATLEETIANSEKELDRIYAEKLEVTTSIEKLKLSVIEEENKKAAYLENIAEYSERAEIINSKLVEFDLFSEEQELQRIKLKEKIKALNVSFEEISTQIIKKEEIFHKNEISTAKLDTEKEALYFRLNDELNLTFAEGVKYKSPIENIEKYKEEIYALKSKITALGIVNLGAIEEYTTLKEKYSFLSEQQQDLVNSKQQLLTVIDEMSEKMRFVFEENFVKLKENFNETFQELFKGGRADLIIDGDLLDSNIEINVEPPGKKLQNITLLSGGEKVLSAIALLFAILKMKPTPFCILDEIEAALDDANVDRYAEFLKRFSNRVQFIVITHRKGTMESSNVLYGITMEEKGVSKIVSVDFKN